MTPVAPPSLQSKAPKKGERFITIERFKGLIRVRLKKINRHFLLPEEVEQIQKELNELTAEETEILKAVLEQLYGPPPLESLSKNSRGPV